MEVGFPWSVLPGGAAAGRPLRFPPLAPGGAGGTDGAGARRSGRPGARRNGRPGAPRNGRPPLGVPGEPTAGLAAEPSPEASFRVGCAKAFPQLCEPGSR